MCEATPLTTRYRWRTKLPASESVFALKASSAGPMAVLEGFEPGAVISIIVQAVNGNAQSVPSPAVEVMIPPAAPAEWRTPAPPPALTAAARTG